MPASCQHRWLTSGDGSELDLLVWRKACFSGPRSLRDLAVRRMQESREAATILGVPADRLFFLAIPIVAFCPSLLTTT